VRLEAPSPTDRRRGYPECVAPRSVRKVVDAELAVGIPIWSAHTEAELNELHPPPKPGTYKWVPHKPEPPQPRDEIEAALVEWNYEWEQGELDGWPSDEALSDWQARGRGLAHRLQDRHPEWQVLYAAEGAWEFMKPPWDEAQ